MQDRALLDSGRHGVLDGAVSRPEGEGESTGRVTYRGTSFDGEVTTVMKDGDATMKVVTRLSGKRIGACA